MNRGLVGAIAVAVALAGAAPAQAACADADLVPESAKTTKRAAKAVLCLVNAERTSRGLPALAVHAKLRKSAAQWATRMDVEDFFAHDHDGSTVRKRIAATGYLKGASKVRVGENIGWGSGSLATPTARVHSWMAGGLHRKNILSRAFRHIGVAAAGAPKEGVTSGSTFVLNFGGLKK